MNKLSINLSTTVYKCHFISFKKCVIKVSLITKFSVFRKSLYQANLA